MAKLTSIIPPQNFELVRDRIGLILADELQNQYALTGYAFLNVSVFVERMVAIDFTEMPLVCVSLARGEYGAKDVETVAGTYPFNIDFYVSKTYSNAEVGDVTANMNLQRLVGMVRAIIENPQYRTLDFAPPSLSSVRVAAFDIEEQSNDPDTQSVARARMVVEVVAPEGVQLLNAPAASLGTTIVKLHETEKGYRYVVDNNANRVFVDQASNPYQAQDDKILKPTS